MSSDKVNVYGQNQKAQLGNSGNSRDTDARALAASALRMEQAKNDLANTPKSKVALKTWGEAIRHNQYLWTIFQVAVCDPNSPLPQDLKVTLLNLARYVDKTSFVIVGKYVPDQIDSLISINRILAVGLNKMPPQQAVVSQMPVEPSFPTSLMTSA